ncbi:MAG: hypothetical protein U0105_13980 [Candidatus Obscuribacterales bacterium]
MPWTEQEIADAVKVLTDAAKIGPIEKVTLEEESYVVAGEVTYTDEIYLEALEELKRKNTLKLDNKSDERETYNSAA